MAPVCKDRMELYYTLVLCGSDRPDCVSGPGGGCHFGLQVTEPHVEARFHCLRYSHEWRGTPGRERHILDSDPQTDYGRAGLGLHKNI